MHARKVIVGYLHSEGSQHQPERFHDASNDITDRDKAIRRYNEYKKRVMQTSIHPKKHDNDVHEFFKGIALFLSIFIGVAVITYIFLSSP